MAPQYPAIDYQPPDTSVLPPENATGNYVKVVQRVPVKIVLEPGENHDRRLIPGMSVVPTVLLNSQTNGPPL